MCYSMLYMWNILYWNTIIILFITSHIFEYCEYLLLFWFLLHNRENENNKEVNEYIK